MRTRLRLSAAVIAQLCLFATMGLSTDLLLPVFAGLLVVPCVVAVTVRRRLSWRFAAALIATNVVLTAITCLWLPTSPAWVHDCGLGSGFMVVAGLPGMSLLFIFWTVVMFGVADATVRYCSRNHHDDDSLSQDSKGPR